MLIGYARVSPHDQTLTLQKDALQQAGCGKIFTDTVSSAKAERKGLEKALSVLRPGDCFVVWKLDRLGTSIKAVIRIMTPLEEQGIEFRSLTDNIDTTARGGKQLFRIIGAFRTLMREKTTAGLRVARTRGRKGGRPKTLTAEEIKTVQELYTNTNISIAEICRQMKISRMTFYRYVRPKKNNRQVFRDLFAGCVGWGSDNAVSARSYSDLLLHVPKSYKITFSDTSPTDLLILSLRFLYLILLLWYDINNSTL
jgi:DNA invertase Pin-like site-specific DNA recombinase